MGEMNSRILSPRAWLVVISQKMLVIFSDEEAIECYDVALLLEGDGE